MANKIQTNSRKQYMQLSEKISKITGQTPPSQKYPKCYRNHVNRGQFDTTNTHLHDRSYFWLSTDTSIEGGGVNVVLQLNIYQYNL